MFELTESEINSMVSQNVIFSKSQFGDAFPFVFTEQGDAMLSSVLRSKKAIKVNIAIMRAFVLIRQYALNHKDLTEKLKQIETKFNDVFDVINYLLEKDLQSNPTRKTHKNRL